MSVVRIRARVTLKFLAIGFRIDNQTEVHQFLSTVWNPRVGWSVKLGRFRGGEDHLLKRDDGHYGVGDAFAVI